MIKKQTPFTSSDVGYRAERLDVLNAHFEKMIERDEIQAASYCISRDGNVFAEASLGKFCYRADDVRELQPDSIHKIASVTKLFCAVAIFKLVEDGKLRVAQKVGDFIEEFSHPPFDEITIAQLLSHTSGMQADDGSFENPYFVSPWAFIQQGFENGDDNWIKNSLKSGMRKKPGTEWAYCTFGFIILGEIVSRVSGMFADDYIMENIVKPCEMQDTGFDRNNSVDRASRIILTNERREKLVAGILAGTAVKNETEKKWNKVPSTGGGLCSTAGDLVKFGTMLLHNGKYNGHSIISRKAIERMTTRFTTPDIKDYCWGAGGVERPYALGPDLRNDQNYISSKGTYFHEGAGACCLFIDPVEKLVASWFVPFTHDNWHPHGLYNVSSIILSGLE
jgi:serine-type D-Ala-D-Ala carboxypeptidase